MNFFIRPKAIQKLRIDQIEFLIDILEDKDAREDEKDDAAMDLYQFKDSRVLDALYTVASDPFEDEMVVESSAESIGKILIGLNYFDGKSLNKMSHLAQHIVFNYIMAHKAEMIKEPLRGQLTKKFG